MIATKSDGRQEAPVARVSPLGQTRFARAFRAASVAMTLALPPASLHADTGVVVVTHLADSGSNSLRQAMLDANAVGGGTLVLTNLTGTIRLLAPLPAIGANVRIEGPGPKFLSISGNFSVRGFEVEDWAAAEIVGLTITECSVTNGGGGILNRGSLLVSNCAVTRCANMGSGGGVWNSGTLVLSGCTIGTNAADAPSGTGFGMGGAGGAGGGVFSQSGILQITNCLIVANWASGGNGANAGSLGQGPGSGGAGVGGGICVSGGSTWIQSCTVLRNQTYGGWGGSSAVPSYGGSRGGPAYGAGIYGAVRLVNCTISSNTCHGGGGGSGIRYDGAGGDAFGGGVAGFDLDIANCTIVGNSVQGAGPTTAGAIDAHDFGTNALRNNLIWGNSGGSGYELSGTFLGQGGNWIGDLRGITGIPIQELLTGDPKLGPLQDNGGGFPTYLPQEDSPLVDAGVSLNAPAFDQRGVERVRGTALDIGAVELPARLPTVFPLPLSYPVALGDDLVLPVVASGSKPLRFQWRKHDMDVPGATNATLVIPSVAFSDSGHYTVVVGNALRSVTSSVVTVTVSLTPVVKVPPASVSSAVGWSIVFSVTAAGPPGLPPLSYQWQFLGADIPGATNTSIRLAQIREEHAGDYRVIVSNRFGATTSQVARLTILFSLLVTSLDDSGPGSLRESILTANTNTQVRGQTIDLTRIAGTVRLTQALPFIRVGLRLEGPGRDALSVSGGGGTRVLQVAAGSTCVVSRLTIADGFDSSHVGGAGILNLGDLALEDCRVSGNSVIGGFGGGICNSGTLAVVSSLITGNQVSGEAGESGQHGGGGGGAGLGGGLFVGSGSVLLSNSTMSGNQAVGGAGGVSDFHHDVGRGGRGGSPNGGDGSPIFSYGGFFPCSWCGGNGSPGGFGGGGGAAAPGPGPCMGPGGKGGYAAGNGAGCSGGGGGAGIGGAIFLEHGTVQLVNTLMANNGSVGGPAGAPGPTDTNSAGSGLGPDVFNYRGMLSASNSPTARLAGELVAVLGNSPSKLVLPGADVSFSITVTGTPPVTVQWTKNGVELPDATNLVLRFPSAQTNDTGVYVAVVRNNYSWATSSNMMLTVLAPPREPIVVWTRSRFTGELASVSINDLASASGDRLYLTGSRDPSLFLAAHDGDNNLSWIRWYGKGASGRAVDSDGENNAYLAGSFRGWIQVGGQTIQGDDADEIFLMKFTPTGDVRWFRRLGEPSHVHLVPFFLRVRTDNASNSIVAGCYSTNSSYAEAGDLFVAKFDPEGNQLWFMSGQRKEFGSPFSGGLALDRAGNSYITSASRSPSMTLGSIVINNGGGPIGAFVAKLTSKGEVEWARPAHDYPPSVFGGIRGDAISIDGQSNVVVAGTYYGTIQFGSNSFTEPNGGFFIARYSASGALLDSWSPHSSAAYLGQMQADEEGNVFVSGQFSGALDFDPVGLIARGSPSAFVVKYSPSGRLKWGLVPGWESSWPVSMALDNNGYLFVGFGNSFAKIRTSSGSLNLAAEGPGTILSSPRRRTWDAGDEVTLTAVPDAGASFRKWSDGVTDNPRRIIVGAADNYSARFSANLSLTVKSYREAVQPSGFLLTLAGEPAKRYWIEAADDLRNWVRLSVVSNSSGVAEFLDRTATNRSQRFYRSVADSTDP